MSPRFCVSFLLSFLALAAALCAQLPEVLHRVGSAGAIYQLVEGRDGAFYGMTNGKVFRLTRSGEYRVIHRFNADVVFPLVAAEDGHLYGFGRLGATPSLIRLSYSGRAEELHTFPAGPGGSPVTGHSLVQGPDGALYGTTFSAQDGSGGILFRATLDGSVTVVADFAGTQSWYPTELVVGHDGAFRARTWVNTGNPFGSYTSIIRIGMDGTITSAVNAPLEINYLSFFHAHPDGNYYLFGHGPTQRLSPSGDLTPLPASYSFGGRRPFLARDGHFYIGVYRDREEWQIIRIAPDGTAVVVTRRLGHAFAEADFLAQSHRGDLFGVAGNGHAYTYIRWRPEGQTAVNLGPYAAPDFARPPRPGSSRVIRVLANDRDVNGDSLEITAINSPRFGTATLAPNGKSIFYTAPTGDPLATDEFTYELSDGQGGHAIGRVSLRADARGQYGVLLAEEDPRADGYITARASGFGGITGQLWVGGFLWRFGGILDAENRFTATVVNEAFQTATVNLHATSGGTIEATIVANGSTIEAVLTAPNLKKAAAVAGAYTFVIPSEKSWRSLPKIESQVHGQLINNPLQQAQGDGFGRWRILPNGAAILIGKMPDGAPFSAGNLLDRAGQLQMFVTMYPYDWTNRSMRGWARGSISFQDKPGVSDADGALRWAITVPGIGIYMAPLEQEIVNLRASRYTPPADLRDALSSTLQAELDGGGLQTPLTGTVFASGIQLTANQPFRLNGKLDRSTGLLQGHFARPNKSQWTPWSGVLFQKQRSVFGRFHEFSGHRDFWDTFPGSGKFQLLPE